MKTRAHLSLARGAPVGSSLTEAQALRDLPPPASAADATTKGRAVGQDPLKTREMQTWTPRGESRVSAPARDAAARFHLSAFTSRLRASGTSRALSPARRSALDCRGGGDTAGVGWARSWGQGRTPGACHGRGLSGVSSWGAARSRRGRSRDGRGCRLSRGRFGHTCNAPFFLVNKQDAFIRYFENF